MVRPEHVSTRRSFGASRHLRMLITLVLLALAVPSMAVPRAAQAQAGTGSGLKGEYYDNMDLTNLKLTRTDPTINFNWGSGSPAANIGADGFSVLWTGQVQPQFSETYTFFMISDNGRRVWVNGQLLINQWINDWNVTYSGQIALAAGQHYDIRVEYFEYDGGAGARLEWSSPSQARQVIPQSQLYPPVPPPGSIDLAPLWDTEKVLVNPHKGWYHHYFDNGIDRYLPNADSDLDNFPGMNHIYLRLAWSYLEPQEGQFNWQLIDDVINKWVAKGYEISFRITAKETELTYATPEWVKNAGVPGAFYEKWGRTTWEPDYSNAVFLQKLENFHHAFAARYASQPWLADIDMGSFGNWGEGHNIFGSERAFPSSVIKQHIDLYKRQYPNNLITISDDYAWYNQDANQTADYVYQQGLAWRDDSPLVPWYVDNFPTTFTVRHPEYFERMWRERPINLELDHYGTVKSAGVWQGTDGAIKGADILRGAMGLMHPTYMGYHGYADEWLRENPNLAKQLANKMGYWYFIKNVTLPPQVAPGSASTFKLTWENHGVAPAYNPYKLKLKLVGSSQTYSQDLSEANNRAWMPDAATQESYQVQVPANLPPGSYKVRVALIEDRPAGQRQIALGFKDSVRMSDQYYELGSVEVTNGQAAPPVSLILDTDIEEDVDDAGAVAMLNAMQDNGEVRILGMMVNTPGEWGAPCLDALNTYYNHPDIPIGTLKPTTSGTKSRFNQQIAQNYPNDLQSGSNAPDATTLYRQLLAGQPNNSVVIASVGKLTNLKNLLNSGADAASPLNGYDLVAQKVKLLSVMGGRYPSGSEWNFEQDPAAAARVVNDWPGRMVFSGFEVGDTVYTGARLFSETPSSNPVRKAYELYVGTGNTRNSWDQTAAYYAVRGTAGLYSEAGGTGSNLVNSGNGSNAWQSTPDKNQNYLVKTASDSAIATAIEDLMVQAPKSTAPTGVFVKGINFNGPAVTIDGNLWQSYSQALGSGLSVGAGVNTATHNVTPNPATSGDTITMLRSELWKPGDMNLSQTLANGSYQVSFWVLEDYQNGYHRFDARLEGANVTTVQTGNVGAWQRYGPYNVTVTDGVLNLDLIRLQGDTLILGLEITQ